MWNALANKWRCKREDKTCCRENKAMEHVNIAITLREVLNFSCACWVCFILSKKDLEYNHPINKSSPLE